MKRGDKVKTIYGDIETVLDADKYQVVTYESFLTGAGWHPTKVWLCKQENIAS